MGKRWIRNRGITVEGRDYIYSVMDHRDDRELRIYQQREKIPLLSLRLTYPETWAVDLFRPKAAAYIIKWYEGQSRKRPAALSLQEEPALFQGLLDMFFPPEEQERRERFLKRLGAEAPQKGGRNLKRFQASTQKAPL